MASESSGPWTVLKLINWTRDYLAAGAVEDPRLAAEVLLAKTLGCKRIDLYTRFDHQPGPEELTAFRELVKRARQHEPVAYLVGQKEFFSLRMKVTSDVLVPRPETELLVAEAISHLRRLGRPGLMWDACTGSGCVAMAVAVNVPDATVLASDISEPAVAVAGENARAHHVEQRVRCRKADLLTLPGDCGDLKDFDVITANPPYIADGEPVGESVKHEPASSLYAGSDGLEFIRPILRQAPALLRPGGLLAMEFGYRQAQAVWDLLAASKAYASPKLLKDHQGIDRAIVATRP